MKLPTEEVLVVETDIVTFFKTISYSFIIDAEGINKFVPVGSINVYFGVPQKFGEQIYWNLS